MPTKHPRASVTLTPSLQAAREQLRERGLEPSVGELALRGANSMLGEAEAIAADFALLAEELAAMPLLRLEPQAVGRALAAQAELAATSGISHRVKPIDLLVAAVAEHHGAAVLHCDGDYELLAEHTTLAFSSVWVAGRGSMS